MSDREIDELIIELFRQLTAEEKEDAIRFAEQVKEGCQ